MKAIVGVGLVILLEVVLLMVSIGPIGALVSLVGGLFALMSFAPLVMHLENERAGESLREAYVLVPVASAAGSD